MFNSLRTKIFLLFTLGLLLVISIIIIIFTAEVYNRYKELFIQRGNTASMQLAFQTEQLLQLGLLPREFVGYEKLCSNIIKENKGIVYVALLSNKNKPIFQVGNLSFYQHFLNNSKNEFFINFPLENHNNHDNSILVILNENFIDEKIYSFLKSVFLYSLISILIIVIFVLFYLKINLGIPLNSLIKRINNSNLNSNYNEDWELLKRNDEFGLVANAYEKLMKNLLLSQDSLCQSNKELIKLNTQLDKRVEEEVKKNREKDFLLIEQSKITSMGEMISNIAHQWRQPLSVITSCSTGLKLQKELGDFNDKDFYESLDNINEKAQYLSGTIDSFRDFLNNKKEFKKVVLQDELNKLICIISETLKTYNIKLENNFEDNNTIKLNLVPGDFNQAIINIINNAKDLLIEKNITNPMIKLDLIEYKTKIVLTIEDNAGGIADEVISHIFEPYYTTKHKAQGTGLSLNISYRIITDILNGNIHVKNTDVGAKFFIELPLCL